jgi:ABC-type phosphate transport system substrate-binding protein
VVAKDALAVIKNNARASSIPGCASFVTLNMTKAIWQGWAYNNATDAATRPAAFPAFYTPVRHTWASIWPACAGEPWGGNTIVPVARIRESGTRDSFNSINGFQRSVSTGSPAPFNRNAIYTDELLSQDAAGTPPAGGVDPNAYAYACTTGGLGCTYNPPQFGIAPRQQGNSQMDNAITGNPDWLGYTSLAFTKNVTTIPARCGAPSYTNCTGATGDIAPTKANVQNNTYPLRRDLYMFTNTDSDPVAVNFVADMLTARYQSIVANVGYVEVIPLNTNPPNWDIDLGAGSNSDVFDVVALGNDWRRTCPSDPNDIENPTVRGCTRADVTFDGTVDVSDISAFGGCWNKTWGPAAPNVSGCWDNISGYPR